MSRDNWERLVSATLKRDQLRQIALCPSLSSSSSIDFSSRFSLDSLDFVNEGQVISCHSIDEWKEHFRKGLESKKLVVIDFTASWWLKILCTTNEKLTHRIYCPSWCGLCLFIEPILAEIAKKTPHVIFLKVDVDELKTVAEEYNVDAMPTFVFLKEGKQVDKVVGARKEDLQAKITELSSITA